MVVDLRVNLGKLSLQNPVVTASGTFGYGVEFADFLDLDCLGAITLKSVTLKPKTGNPPPRIHETPSGMMNSIGLENKGLAHLIAEILPPLSGLEKVKVIANIAGHTHDENVTLAKALNKEKRVDALELNISCPNVDAGGLAFCHDLLGVANLVADVRQEYSGPLIVKLSQSVADLLGLAEAAIKNGADILSLINTVPGLEIDVAKRKLVFARKTAGLSGPAIRPIALKAVYDVASAFDVPIIGMGGVATCEDVLKFLLAGADAVAVGMMNFVRPSLAAELVQELGSYLVKNKLTLADLVLSK